MPRRKAGGRLAGREGEKQKELTGKDLRCRDQPANASAYNNLALALRDTGQTDAAVAAFKKAIELNPDLDGPRRNLGSLLLDRGKIDEAIAVLQEDVRHKPDHATSHYNLGVALAHKGRREEAMAAYRLAIRHHFPGAEAHLNLGNLLRDKGDLQAAIEHYQQALRIDPKCWQALGAHGLALCRMGKQPEAITLYEQALKLKADEPQLLNDLARLLTTLGDTRLRDTRRAAQLAGRAVKLSPKRWAYWLTLGVARYRSEDWKEAEEALSQAIELRHPQPLIPEMVLYYAMALWRIDKREDAREAYQHLARLLGGGQSLPEGLVRLRAEAAALLGIKEPSPVKESPAPK